MHINLTLIGQSITFLIFVWFCMKFIWPVIRNAMDARTQQIAAGLSAAERAHRDRPHDGCRLCPKAFDRCR